MASKLDVQKFCSRWENRGYEKGESQKFWIDFLQTVLDVENATEFIEFEDRVHLDKTSFIDAYIPSTKILIEQKSCDVDLRKPIIQSDGSMLTPFQQAKKYVAGLSLSKHPRYIITCNFKEFHIYDMEQPNSDPEIISLKDLPKESYRFDFVKNADSELVQKELEISIKAGELVGQLYNAFAKKYHNLETNDDERRSLNILCVRLVFCFYAEDAGIFAHQQFFKYIASFKPENLRMALIDLFKVLDTKIEDRDEYLDDKLAAFPYVNGGMFTDENIIIPQIDGGTILLLRSISESFDWSDISPTIFGAVFESTLNPETRRSGGMHYTSIENIHKVIDPLFLDDLTKELDDICDIKIEKTRKGKILAYQDKLSKLTFFDPACGSGNFLTETYLSLRRLENRAISTYYGGVAVLGVAFEPIKVSIKQFYGIEINDFAVNVAKTALWISEYKMMKETQSIVFDVKDDFLPLKSYENIVEGNALRIDWESVVPKEKLNYIMGNPPFIGGMLMTPDQKDEIKNVVGDIVGVGEMDYVVAWYYKACKYIKHSKIEVAFVSTNSICQGQQAITVWEPLINSGLKIQFAHHTFIWNSEAKTIARVHCIVVGFAMHDRKEKIIYDGKKYVKVSNINSYLLDSENIFIKSQSSPICNVPKLRFGSMPRDDGGFILNDEERKILLEKEPLSAQWIHPYLGAYEFINNKSRWCLWLVNAKPNEIKQCPIVVERIQHIKTFREQSKAEGTRKFAATPTLFCQIAQPSTDYIAVPKTSSERRRYIPMGFLSSNVIASDLLFLIPDAKIYHFGILMSNVHNAWMRVVGGRLKSDYRYAKDIIYNTFVWPNPTAEQKEKIEKTAQAILDARALYPDSSLADLYDETAMPPELRKAHQENDKAVMQAYGFDMKMTESDCVAELMKLYQKATEK